MNWRQYEHQIFEEFRRKFPGFEILFDQQIVGRFSKTKRQIDILVKFRVLDVDCISAFDCKCFSKRVNVQTIDYMVGYLDDIGAKIGGVVTAKGFSEAATNRASAASISLRTIEFTTVPKLVEQFIPRLDFSDPRNSMLLALIN